MIFISISGALIWIALYWLDVRMRKRKSEDPDLLPMRIFYAVSGIFGQILFWSMAIRLKEWGGN